MTRKLAAVPAAPRKTLLEWIDDDDGDTPGSTQPTCGAQVRALHARLGAATDGRSGAIQASEPLPAPAGLLLPPLG